MDGRSKLSADRTGPGRRRVVAGEVFTTSEMARLARLSPSQVRRCVYAGVIDARRGIRRRFEYGLSDLLVLRTAKTLLDAGIGPSRTAELLAELRRNLPRGREVSSVLLTVEGDEVIARQATQRWRLGSGQMLLGFDKPPASSRAVEELGEPESAHDDRAAYRAFTRGLALEAAAPDHAKEAYREALRLDPTAVPAMVNLGRLEHVEGRLDAAEALYLKALQVDDLERTAAFNLALLAEDRGDTRVAVRRYVEVLEIDPDHTDSHHRLAHLYARLGRASEARKHRRSYRELLRRR